MSIEDVALTMIPRLGTKSIVHLLDIYHSASAIFAATADELLHEAGLHPDTAQLIASRKAFAAAERELAYCARHGITPVSSTDEIYPPLMREIPDYPHVLYIRGNTGALGTRCLSVVGTREATSYGHFVCNRVIPELAERLGRDLCIVSGLAFGIDAMAHRAAIAAGVPTIGILPNALPDIVPASHTHLAEEILAHGGAIVTELTSQSRQNGHLYIARNRLIAAISAGTLVVESPSTGGSLSTAELAAGYNRAVMAVPGRIGDKISRGTNHLIHTGKATLVNSAAEIASELAWEQTAPSPRIPAAGVAAAPLSDAASALLARIDTHEPVSFDRMSRLSDTGPGELLALLLELEMAGAIRQLPGSRYERI